MFLGSCTVVPPWRYVPGFIYNCAPRALGSWAHAQLCHRSWAHVQLCPPGAMFLGLYTVVSTWRYVPGLMYSCVHLVLCSWAHIHLCPTDAMFLCLRMYSFVQLAPCSWAYVQFCPTGAMFLGSQLSYLLTFLDKYDDPTKKTGEMPRNLVIR
jgi:hypothetical protein